MPLLLEELLKRYAIGGTSKEILYRKLGFESLKDTGSLRRLSESMSFVLLGMKFLSNVTLNFFIRNGLFEMTD